jgi:1-deoxyxylulose-5-phosphate synthase
VKRAIELGINFFDTANTYSYGGSDLISFLLAFILQQFSVSEEVTGRAIAESGLKREEAVIATKVFFQTSANPAPNTTGLSRKNILAACDASLKRLGTDYIDLYQIHRWDNDTPIEETLEVRMIL